MNEFQMIPQNPIVHAQNLTQLLDQYDENFELFKTYNERLLINLGEVFNKTTLPISSIAGELMSRMALKKLLLGKSGFYSRLKDIENLITVRVVVYFNDDIDLAVSLIKKEFVLNDSIVVVVDNMDQDRFGINTRRYAITLLPEQYARLEYQRFVGLKAELEIRTVLQHSWSEVKSMFDALINSVRIPEHNVNKLAQISYLLKMADEELVRIKEQILTQRSLVEPQTVAEREFPTVEDSLLSEPEVKPVDAPVPDESVRTMEHFILNDSMVRELDRAIADHYETRLVYKENFVIALTEVYLRISIHRGDRMREELMHHKNIITELMKKIFGDNQNNDLSYIYKGSSLLVLYYILLAKTGNLDIIKRNVRNLFPLKGISVEEFANDLLMNYKKAIKKEVGVAW